MLAQVFFYFRKMLEINHNRNFHPGVAPSPMKFVTLEKGPVLLMTTVVINHQDDYDDVDDLEQQLRGFLGAILSRKKHAIHMVLMKNSFTKTFDKIIICFRGSSSVQPKVPRYGEPVFKVVLQNNTKRISRSI